MVDVKSATVFGERLYYLYCNNCKSWVKSGVGQFVWTSPQQPYRIRRNHKCHGATTKSLANGTPTMINTDDYLEGICAVAFTKDGEEYDQCYTWETAQTMANEGYTVIAIRNDGHMDKREIQNICNYELEVALDCFGEDHLK